MVLKISWDNIIELLLKAQNQIILVLPAIHEEWVQVIQSNPNLNNVEIKVCIDNSEETIRKGYGSIKSVDVLKTMATTFKECEGLKINLLCIDEEAYLLFLESRIISGDPVGFNAIKIQEPSISSILKQIFPSADDKNETTTGGIISSPLQEIKIEEIKKALEENPIEEPDIKRKVWMYNNLFQYTELHLEGGNLSSKTIAIPSSALPFKDAELKSRIKSRINLFEKEETEQWAELLEIKNKLTEIREKYLTPCKLRKDKSILKKTDKEEYLKEIKELIELAENNSNSILDKVQTAINATEETLVGELRKFWLENPPETLKNLNPENAEKQITREINAVIAKINLPSASSLVNKINVAVVFYDLTREDLDEKPLIDWFLKEGIITEAENRSIAKFSNAFAIKKSN